jgi:hypothetical protein
MNMSFRRRMSLTKRGSVFMSSKIGARKADTSIQDANSVHFTDETDSKDYNNSARIQIPDTSEMDLPIDV